jgi:hypothetical protein
VAVIQNPNRLLSNTFKMNTPFTKSIIVLANSIKKGGRCVAGIEVTPGDGKAFNFGDWIRPIDPTEDEGTIPNHRMLIGNVGLKPLDCIKIQFERRANDPYHPEDFEITTLKWEQDGCFSNEVFDLLPDESDDLWGAGSATSRKVEPKEGIKTLRLIKPKGDCHVRAYREDTPWGVKHRRLLHVLHYGVTHQFSIDDPDFSARHNLSPSAVGDSDIRIDLLTRALFRRRIVYV